MQGWLTFEVSHKNPRAADKHFREILAKEPTHFLANFGHLFVLHFGELTEKIRSERLRFAKAVLDNAPKSPKGEMQELAVRYAANTFACDIFSREKSAEKLGEALRYAEIGARNDPHFDSTLSLVTGTKAEILVALGRDEEAYRLAEKVLRVKPAYPDFVTIQKSPGFKRWQKKRAREQRHSFAELIGDDLATDLNCAMLASVDGMNTNAKHAPMALAMIDRVRMQLTRGDPKTTVPLPPSLKALLAYDAKLRIHDRPVFEPYLGKNPREGTLTSTTMTDVFRASSVAKGYRDLKKSAEADMPALIELPLGGDQRVFMYVVPTANPTDEYPIIRFDDEPCIWVSSGCLQDEICMLPNAASSNAHAGVKGAQGRKRAAKKANEKWLDREPEQRLVETDDDDD